MHELSYLRLSTFLYAQSCITMVYKLNVTLIIMRARLPKLGDGMEGNLFIQTLHSDSVRLVPTIPGTVLYL